MKRFATLLVAIGAFLAFSSIELQATTSKNIGKSDSLNVAADAMPCIYERLNEIKTMDKSHLTKFEKQELRKETRSLQTKMKDIGGGVYLSGAAIVVIVVLLILLL